MAMIDVYMCFFQLEDTRARMILTEHSLKSKMVRISLFCFYVFHKFSAHTPVACCARRCLIGCLCCRDIIRTSRSATWTRQTSSACATSRASSRWSGRSSTPTLRVYRAWPPPTKTRHLLPLLRRAPLPSNRVTQQHPRMASEICHVSIR